MLRRMPEDPIGAKLREKWDRAAVPHEGSLEDVERRATILGRRSRVISAAAIGFALLGVALPLAVWQSRSGGSTADIRIEATVDCEANPPTLSSKDIAAQADGVHLLVNGSSPGLGLEVAGIGASAPD